MSIPESQFDTWAKQGAITGSSSTYKHIKSTLEASGTPFADKSFKVFLQGSYGNDTNIYSESDVDVVIRIDSTFQSDVSGLNVTEKQAYSTSFVTAEYQYSDFKRDVLLVLTDAYGSGVKAGAKAIMVPASNSRRKADVIVSIAYRRYSRFGGIYDSNYVEGIAFYTLLGELIANFPKQHSANLSYKHQNTGSWLKPVIRTFKNLRSKLVDKGRLQPNVAPSYYLEGLLYNVPSNQLHTSYADCFCNALNWLSTADKSQLLCANEQYFLLRSGFHTSWEPNNCDKFLREAAELWNNW